MYKVLDKTWKTVLVKMDIHTFEEIKKDIQEDINSYEFVFDKPIKASELINL